jgi:hypothetical protein
VHRENVELSQFALRRNVKIIRRLAKRHSSGSRDEASSQENNYLQEWEDLEALLEFMVKTIKRTTGSYLQTVAASDAQFANIQAMR